jgi:phosphatidate phosphatase APP1
MPVVWQLSIIQFHEKTLVSGVLLKKTPSLYSHKVSRLKNLLKVGGTYFIHAVAGRQVNIRFGDKLYDTRTTGRGSFNLVLEKHETRIPQIMLEGNDEPLEIIQEYPVVLKQTQSKFDVISDIDDTILRSYSSDAFRRITTLALTSPYKRKVIGFTRSLFKQFSTQDARVFYISKSESNLFDLLTSYIRFNEFPEGAMFLTSYLSLMNLFNPHKGHDYKLNHIRFIMRNSADKKFYLLGDDGQRDMEIYLAVASEFPGRIANVFIRQTRSKKSSRQKEMWEKLKQKVPRAVYYQDGDETKSSFETLLDFAETTHKKND